MNTRHKKYQDSTIASTVGIGSDKNFNAVMPPIYLSTTYKLKGYGIPAHYDYSRSANPTRDAYAAGLTALEGGADTCVTNCGLSAINLVLHLLTSDDTIFLPYDCYGGSIRMIKAKAKLGQLKYHFIDPEDLDALEKEFQEHKPKMIMVESPSNPVLRLTDIAAVSALAKKYGCLSVVDNTFLSPILQKPIELGADIVLHSTTKIINGHSDVIGGAVIFTDPEMGKEMHWWNNCIGTSAAPFDCYMSMRGMRTLKVRAYQQSETAQKIADFLESHDAIEKVYYPGLKSHPQYALAQKQQKASGTMISFDLKEKQEEKIAAFIDALKLINLAESLGSVETLLCHPPSMTHASLTEEEREKAGISKGLLRLSVGLEDADDLITELEDGLKILG